MKVSACVALGLIGLGAPAAASHPATSVALPTDAPPASARLPPVLRGGLSGVVGSFVTLTDDLDCLSTGLTVNFQTGCAVWSDPSLTQTNLWRGTTVANRQALAVGASVPAGGPDPNGVWNQSSGKLQVNATQAFPPGLFFNGARYNFQSIIPGFAATFEPTASQVASLEHDMFVTSIATQWTSETIASGGTSISNRLLWGGTCVDEPGIQLCADIGLPSGPILHAFVLAPVELSTSYVFLPARWIDSAPDGAMIGDPVAMPVGSWVRVRHETTQTRVRVHLDLHDGAGMRLVYDGDLITNSGVSGYIMFGSFESVDPIYTDNLAAGGVYTIPGYEPAQSLVCGPNGFLDDLQSIPVGALNGQNGWSAASGANVQSQSNDHVIRYTNTFSDQRHREVMSRPLPIAYPINHEPWQLCVQVSRNGGAQTSVTPFAMAPVSMTDNSYVTRVAMGRYDPNALPPFSSRVFIQHNPAYDPIDDENCVNCTQPGPNGNGGVPVIGGAGTIGQPGFDYYDTGVSLGGSNVEQQLCIGVNPDGTLFGAYGGVELVGGSTGVTIQAFVASIDEMRFEVEHTLDGQTNNWFLDDVGLDCTDLPLVSLPPFVLPYTDQLEWGIDGVTIDVHDNDGSSITVFRWASAPNTPIADLGAKSNVLKMENTFRDTAQSLGDFTLFTKASTQLPNVTVAPGIGYAAGGDFKLTDGATTRAWAIGEKISPNSTLFVRNVVIAYSAGTGTIWVQVPDDADPVHNDETWVDTGRSLASLGVGLNQWFSLRIHHAPNGTFIVKVNGQILTDVGGDVVRVPPQQSVGFGVHNNLDRLHFLGGDDQGAPAGSILYADNIRAWTLPCPGDVNDDGAVTFADLNLLLSQYNQTVGVLAPANILPDADGDGVADDAVVNFIDLNGALGQYNNPCD